jgi:hypothetical protein
MRPNPGIETFHYLGFINFLENGCQEKSARIMVIDERPEKLAGYPVK